MARDKKTEMMDTMSDEQVLKEVSAPVVETPKKPQAKAAAVVPAVMITFDRWFALSGRPVHHKAGMKAFINTKGKRTVAAWMSAFQSY